MKRAELRSMRSTAFKTLVFFVIVAPVVTSVGSALSDECFLCHDPVGLEDPDLYPHHATEPYQSGDCDYCHIPHGDDCLTCHTADFEVKQAVFYLGYLDKTQDGVLADTLITVTQGSKLPVPVYLLVYDKYGNEVAESWLADGGQQVINVAAKGFAWITLGMIVGRATLNPLGSPGGEGFSFKITSGKYGGNLKPTLVEVEQAIYHSRQQNPGKAIWNPANIASRSETALGGVCGPGVTIVPKAFGN